LVRHLRAQVADVAITTDLIVGYPGETRQMHENTLAFAREVGFQRTHVFRYSPRPRTDAETRPDDVPLDEKTRRHAELTEVVTETNRAFTARYLGETLPVLIEGRQGASGMASGHTANYIEAKFAAPRELIGQIVPVRLTEMESDGAAKGVLALPPEAVAALVAQSPKVAPQYSPLAMASAAE